MESINELLTILRTRTPGNSIARITLSLPAWVLLHVCASEYWICWSGFSSDEFGPPLIEENPNPRITFDPEQFEDFRLWDWQGREILLGVDVGAGALQADC